MQRSVKAVLLSLALGGCADAHSPATPAAPPPADPGGAVSMTLTASPASVMTSSGDTRSIRALVRNARGEVLTSQRVQWSSSNPGVASISNTNVDSVLATAIDDGTTNITATLGSITQSVSLDVRRRLASVELTGPATTLEYGFSMQLVARAFDARHHFMPGATGFTYESNNPISLVVSPTGVVTTLFQFPQNPSSLASAKLTLDGVTAVGYAEVTAVAPSEFNFFALLLTDYVRPVAVPFRGAGLAFFTLDSGQILYRLSWSELTGPATRVELRGPAGGNETGELIAELAAPRGPNTYGLITGLFSASDIRSQGGRPPMSIDSVAALLCARKAYLEVQTVRFPNGELRGPAACK